MPDHTLRRLLLAGAVASALGVTACGSGGSGGEQDGVAALGEKAADAPNADEASAEDPEAPTDPGEAFALFDACMADHGFPMEADEASAGPVVVENESGGSDENSSVVAGRGGVIPPEDVEAFEEANETCGAHMANVQSELEASPEQQAAMEDAVLAMQQCMHDKGFDVQFEVGLGGSGSVSVGSGTADEPGDGPRASGELDQDAFEAAEQECAAVFDDYPELDDIPLPGR